MTSAGKVQISNSYDLLGRRVATETEDGGLIEYGYDAVGNQASVQSPVLRADNDSETKYRYSFGNLVGVDYPDATPDVSLTWGGYNGASTANNGAGRMIRVQDAARHRSLG